MEKLLRDIKNLIRKMQKHLTKRKNNFHQINLIFVKEIKKFIFHNIFGIKLLNYLYIF